ncbi:MAG: amidohydrolase, partial [Acidobacteriota bacterium]
MRKSISLLALLVFAFSPAAAQSQKSQPVAFIHVNVVPMDSERIIENQTVIIRDGRIAEIGPSAKVKIPRDALRIEARGKYLMPGLAEMHGHLPNPNQGEAVTQSFLTLFVANGVTTVRGMFGFPNHPALRDR